MSYNANQINILDKFYPVNSSKSNPNLTAGTTYFKVNNIDISNNYVGIGDGLPGTDNTGGGGGGAQNNLGIGGKGGSVTVIFYILPSGVST